MTSRHLYWNVMFPLLPVQMSVLNFVLWSSKCFHRGSRWGGTDTFCNRHSLPQEAACQHERLWSKEKCDKSFCLGTQSFWNHKRTNWGTSLIWVSVCGEKRLNVRRWGISWPVARGSRKQTGQGHKMENIHYVKIKGGKLHTGIKM